MSDVKWIKLNINMFNDEKIKLIESMPEADTILVIWIKLLSQAGKTNANGYIYLSENIPYTEEMLSTIFNRPVTTVRLALSTFKQFGMVDIDEGDFIKVSNWDKHQNIEGLEKIRKQTNERVKKHREKKKLTSNVSSNVTLTQSNAIELELDKDINNNKIVSDLMNFWDQNGFGFNNLNSKQKLLSFLDDGIDGGVILKSLEIAVDNNKTSYSYVEKVLKDWISRGVKKVSDVESLQKEFEQQKLKVKVRGKNHQNKIAMDYSKLEELLGDE